LQTGLGIALNLLGIRSSRMTPIIHRFEASINVLCISATFPAGEYRKKKNQPSRDKFESVKRRAFISPSGRLRHGLDICEIPDSLRNALVLPDCMFRMKRSMKHVINNSNGPSVVSAFRWIILRGGFARNVIYSGGYREILIFRFISLSEST